jgi:DNA polymerase-3 subunit delta'
MAFANVIGQKKVKKILTRAIEQQHVHHAYLFFGNVGVGKHAMALEFAKALLCASGGTEGCDSCSNCIRIQKLTHPDLIYIFPAPTTVKPDEERRVLNQFVADPYRQLQLWASPGISIERIRELKKKVSLKSFEGRGRVVIISEAHKMTPEAANSLLKILEEPPDKMFFILETSQYHSLLETIISRCQPVSFNLLSQPDIEKNLIVRDKLEPEKAKLISRIAFGSYQRALELNEEDLLSKRKFSIEMLRKIILDEFERLVLVEAIVRENDKVAIKELLGLLLLWYRDALIYSQISPEDATSRDGIIEMIVNIDELATLEKFVKAFDAIDFKSIIFEIENAIELINRNVNVTLILIVLFERLKEFMRRRVNV